MSALTFHMIGGAPDPVAPFSHAVEADGWLFITGQMPFTGTSSTSDYPKTIEAQTHQVMKNLATVLHGCGLRLSDVAAVRVFLRHFDDHYERMNAVYASYFPPQRRPARTCVGVTGLARGALVEIDMIARRDPGAGRGSDSTPYRGGRVAADHPSASDGRPGNDRGTAPLQRKRRAARRRADVLEGGRRIMAKYASKAQSKVKKAMHERKAGTLRSGRSGKKVKSRKQAIAIGLSEARRAGAKVPAKKSSSRKSSSAKKTSARKRSSGKSTPKRSSTKKKSAASKRSSSRKRSTSARKSPGKSRAKRSG